MKYIMLYECTVAVASDSAKYNVIVTIELSDLEYFLVDNSIFNVV